MAHNLFMERFPALGLMMGTWECKEMPKETPPPICLDKEEVFYFYGLSIEAYDKCKKWLEGEKELVFLEDDPGIIASFLKTKRAVEILSNPKVHIELFSKKKDEIQALVEKFPVARIEVASLPSKKGGKNLRLELLRKTTLAHAIHKDRLQGYQPFYNFVKNLKQIPHSFYANGLKGAFQGMPAVVCGAGPSLEPTLDLLRTLENKALIIAGGSTLAALSSKGILPHFGMATDPNEEEYRRFKNSFAFEVPLLYSTRVNPKIFQTCNGPFGYMRSGIGGLLELWIEEELGLLDPLLGDFLSSETISVTGICVAWAQFLGCNPILLNGIDMAYTGKKRYSSGVCDEKVSFDAIEKEKAAADRIIRKKDRNGKVVYSAVRWILESASISHFAKMHPEVQFINTTSGGIGFKGIEYVPIEEAALGFKERPFIREEVFQKLCPMPPNAKEKIDEQLGALRESLRRVIENLETIIHGNRGAAAVAEMELGDEIAALYLFYDVRKFLKPGPNFWQNWLDLALKYEHMMKL